MMTDEQHWSDSEWFRTWETLCREKVTDAVLRAINATQPEPELLQLAAEAGEGAGA